MKQKPTKTHELDPLKYPWGKSTVTWQDSLTLTSTFMDWVFEQYRQIVNNATCVHYIHLKCTLDVTFYHEPIWQFYTLYSPNAPFEKKKWFICKDCKNEDVEPKDWSTEAAWLFAGVCVPTRWVIFHFSGQSCSTRIPQSPDPKHTHTHARLLCIRSLMSVNIQRKDSFQQGCCFRVQSCFYHIILKMCEDFPFSLIALLYYAWEWAHSLSDCFISSCFTHLLISSSHMHTSIREIWWDADFLRENSLSLLFGQPRLVCFITNYANVILLAVSDDWQVAELPISCSWWDAGQTCVTRLVTVKWRLLNHLSFTLSFHTFLLFLQLLESILQRNRTPPPPQTFCGFPDMLMSHSPSTDAPWWNITTHTCNLDRRRCVRQALWGKIFRFILCGNNVLLMSWIGEFAGKAVVPMRLMKTNHIYETGRQSVNGLLTRGVYSQWLLSLLEI